MAASYFYVPIFMRSSEIRVKDILRAPGHGLLTVSTGGVGKDLEKFFPSAEVLAWSKVISRKLKDFSKKAPPFLLLGVPSDSGGGICRGAAHGPAHIRKTLFEKYPHWAAYDLGDIPCIPQLLSDSMLNAKQLRQSREDLFGKNKNFPVSPLDLTEVVYLLLRKEFPSLPILLLGGDHSVSYPCFRALQKLKALKNVGVLHFDAHTDLLERRYGVDVCFGTWTAKTLKDFPNPRAWAQVGIRASRKDKNFWEKKYKISQFWARDLLLQNPEDFASDLILKWRSLEIEKIYITNDIDGTDSSQAPSTGTPEPGGLSAEWISTVIKIMSTEFKLIGADLVEVAPVLSSREDAEKTLQTALKYLEALQW